MIMQTTAKLEQKVNEYQILTEKSKKRFLGKIGKKDKKTKESVDRMLNFFAIPPVDLDPRGIIGKLDKTIQESEHKLDYYIDKMAPDADEEERANLQMGIKGVISVNQVTKIVRHFIEIIKKTKNLQLAMLLQMQMPFIDRMIKSQVKGTEAFLEGQPVGDSIGPLFAASLMDKPGKEEMENVILHKTKRDGRTLYVVKSKGPGGRIGIPNLPKVVAKIAKKRKIRKIITVDAAGKLEGEKTGEVAEGIGVALGNDVYKYHLEKIGMDNDIPVEAIAIKQHPIGEAIEPMVEEILNSEDDIMEALDRSLEDVPKRGSVIVIGVGNTIGVPNSNENLDEVRKQIRKTAKKIKKKQEEEENKGFWSKFFGKKKAS